jgi:hypothetical protein
MRLTVLLCAPHWLAPYHIYEVILENNLTHYVSFGQINDIIGDEKWLQGEGNCLCNIASS